MPRRVRPGTVPLALALASAAALAGGPVRAQSAVDDSTLVAVERDTWARATARELGVIAWMREPRPTSSMPPGAGAVDSAARAPSGPGACAGRPYALDGMRVEHGVGGTARLTYRLTIDRRCEGEPTPRVLRVLAVWARQDGAWRLLSRRALVGAIAPDGPSQGPVRTGGRAGTAMQR